MDWVDILKYQLNLSKKKKHESTTMYLVYGE